jgi:DNA-binding LacI/PurR family transcriptional regulator
LFDGSGQERRQSDALIEATRHVGWAFGALARDRLINKRLLRQEFSGAFEALAHHEVATRMAGQFAMAAARKDITAWVCVNDHLAASAQIYLQNAGLAVPRDCSLAGFDNAPIACALGLTTFDFSFDKIGHHAIQYLLHPKATVWKKRTLSFQGRCIVRSSTGSV